MRHEDAIVQKNYVTSEARIFINNRRSNPTGKVPMPFRINMKEIQIGFMLIVDYLLQPFPLSGLLMYKNMLKSCLVCCKVLHLLQKMGTAYFAVCFVQHLLRRFINN